jgi:hypothetical protein
MLTTEEREILNRLLAEEEKPKERTRDEFGRFAEEEKPEPYALRNIRLVRVRGSYNSYDVRDWAAIERAIGVVIVVAAVLLIAIL